MNAEIITPKVLLDKNMLELNCKSTNFSSSDFWHYTNVNAVSSILNSNSFYVSSFANMNDKLEQELHKEDKDKVHALCFCNSKTEKIPMWYLYAGLSGKGAAIGFTPATMLEFMKSINKVKVLGTGVELIKDIDFELRFGWVFYRDNCRVNYKRKWFELQNKDKIFFEKNNYFIKEYPWEYEKEFRLVFVNKTDIPAEKLIVEFPKEIINKIKIKMAPEVERERLEKIIYNLEGFKKYFTEKLLYSNLKIQMSLYKNNFEDIQEYLIQTIKNEPTKQGLRAKELYNLLKEIVDTDN